MYHFLWRFSEASARWGTCPCEGCLLESDNTPFLGMTGMSASNSGSSIQRITRWQEHQDNNRMFSV